jgi:VanZ family protein
MIPIDQLPRRLRLALYALAVLVLIYLCLAPHQDLPGVELIWDKAEHSAAWMVLTSLGLILSTRRRWAIGVFAVLFGAVIEVAQANMGWGRNGDWRDLVADAIGIAVAYLIWGAARWVMGRR